MPASRLRPSHPWRYLCLFFIFLLSGLWHGANWTFVVWGGLHGLYLAAGLLLARQPVNLSNRLGLWRWPRLQRAMGVAVTFHLVLLAWVFFRAATVSQAWLLLQSMLAFDGYAWVLPSGLSAVWGLPQQVLLTLAVAVMLLVEWAGSQAHLAQRAARAPLIVRGLVLAALVLAVMNLGQPDDVAFIYFKF